MAKKRVSKEFADFLSFVQEQGVVGLAVGLAVGVAAANAVSDIVEGLVSPIIGFILAGTDLAEITWSTGLTRHGEELVFAWGSAANGLLILFVTALVIYYLVRKLRLDRLDKKKE